MDKKDLDMILITLVNELYDGDIEEAKKHEKDAEQIINYLESQMNRFKKIQQSQIINNELQFNKETGEVIFEEGTLVHCASKCSNKKLESIKENGILSGDFIGISEAHQFASGESYFCADFYRAEKPIQAQEFFQRIHKSDDWNRRGPFENRGANAMNLAFIINPNLQIQELLDTNMYNAENDNHCMQKALKLLDSYKETDENRNKISAIPYGIPSNAVSGIVVGNYLLHSEEYIQALQKIFPNCYILNFEGKVFFDPNLSIEENKRRKEDCLEIIPDYCGGYEKIYVDEEIQVLLDVKLKKLNDFIQQNLQNRKNSTDYDLLYKISGMMTKDFKIKDRHFNSIIKPSTMEETKEIALQFFKGLDKELYEKVKGIIEGNSRFSFNMYMLDENEDFSLTDNDGMPVHSKTPRVMERNGKAGIYVPCKGTLEDIYLLVHELSHTFDYVEGPNDQTRNMLGEVTPHCFEAMLSQYLLEKGIATKEDVTNREKGTTISHYDDGVETFAKFELMKIKEQNGDISQDDIIQMQKKYGITNKQLRYVLDRMEGSEPTIDYRARYMTAQLIYPHFMEQYEHDPQNAIMTLKEYFEQIKSNNFIGSLQTLGIEPREDSIQDLIKTANTRFDKLGKTKQFSTQQIGKATINTTTTIKDEAREQIVREEQQIEQEELKK